MQIFLITYFTLFFWLALILPTYRVWRATGINPYKLGSTDSAHDYVGANFRVTMLACAVVVALFVLSPNNAYQSLMSIPVLTNSQFAFFGQTLLTLAMVWILIAQIQMQKSWRIGIDEDVKTELVQTGLFKISRNPIFLGVRVMLLGLFLVLPNAATLVILFSGNLLVQIQVRLEEEFLIRTHSQAYRAYQKQVRRWI